MDRQSRSRRETAYPRSLMFAGTIGLGLGLGLAVMGDLNAGAAIAAGSVAVCGGSVFWGRRAGTSDVPADFREHVQPLLVDAETGLPNGVQLNELLQREIARSLRYGDQSSLAVFDVRITGFQPGEHEAALPPSPARYIAGLMLEAARSSDIVGRIDTTRFAVVLTECDEGGAKLFCERLRTRLGTTAYARTADGKGIYVRAWAGIAHWSRAIDTPEAYLGAAITNMEQSRKGYEAAQAYFRGAAAS